VSVHTCAVTIAAHILFFSGDIFTLKQFSHGSTGWLAFNSDEQDSIWIAPDLPAR
jgi:hypothetical protein